MFWNLIIVLSFSIFLPLYSLAQTKATNKSGSTILQSEKGTWKYEPKPGTL